MKKYLYFILFVALTACDFEQENKTDSKPDTKDIVISYANINKQFGNCQSDTAVYCTKVSISMPKIVGIDTNLVKNFNQTIKAQILNKYLKDSVSQSLDEYADQFIEDYKTIKSKFDKAFGWYTEVNSRVIRQDTNLLVVESAVSIYTGGAHGTDALYYLNFDANSGEILQLSDILNAGSEDKLNQLAQARFKEKLSDDRELEAFQFDNGRFFNDNFGLLEDGLRFYYNTYEIAPYSSGATDITIAYNQLEGVLKQRFRK